MRLYSYWRSSASWRVRIGLNLKGLSYEYAPVHLIRDGGEQRSPAHTARNPMNQVPVLELGDGTLLTQSVAILEYLDEVYPNPPLLPSDAIDRARCRQLTEIVNSGIQPLQNLKVLNHLAAGGQDKVSWAKDVIGGGLKAIEELTADSDDAFLVGSSPTIADVFLVPQLYNARRFGLTLDDLPRLKRIEAHCEALPAFLGAHPDMQPDAE